MIHIKRQEKGLNKQSDTERFSEIYLPIIEKNLYSHIDLSSPLSFLLLSFHNIKTVASYDPSQFCQQ